MKQKSSEFETGDNSQELTPLMTQYNCAANSSPRRLWQLAVVLAEETRRQSKVFERRSQRPMHMFRRQVWRQRTARTLLVELQGMTDVTQILSIDGCAVKEPATSLTGRI